MIVGLEAEVHDVGRQAGLHLARLVAGGTVGLAEGHALAGRGLLEERDDLVEAGLRNGIGDERELRAATGTRAVRLTGAGNIARAAARGHD
jgi:hypothetical protein